MKTLNLIIYVIILSRKHLLSINNVASCSVFFNDYNQMTVTLLKLVIKTLNTLKYKIIFSNFVFFQTRAESNNGDILPLYSLPPLPHIHCYQSHIILHNYIMFFLTAHDFLPFILDSGLYLLCLCMSFFFIMVQSTCFWWGPELIQWKEVKPSLLRICCNGAPGNRELHLYWSDTDQLLRLKAFQSDQLRSAEVFQSDQLDQCFYWRSSPLFMKWCQCWLCLF